MDCNNNKKIKLYKKGCKGSNNYAFNNRDLIYYNPLLYYNTPLPKQISPIIPNQTGQQQHIHTYTPHSQVIPISNSNIQQNNMIQSECNQQDTPLLNESLLITTPPVCPIGITNTLFLYPEAYGFDVPELQNSSSPNKITFGLEINTIKNNFSDIAIVANASLSYKKGYNLKDALQDQWNPESNNNLTVKLEPKQLINNKPIKPWVSINFEGPCYNTYPPNATPELTSYQQGIQILGELFNGESIQKTTQYPGCQEQYPIVTLVPKDTKTNKFKLNTNYTTKDGLEIEGIMFDNEGVNEIREVVKLFETIKDHVPNIKIGWTLSPGSAKNCGPVDLNTCSPPWTKNTNTNSKVCPCCPSASCKCNPQISGSDCNGSPQQNPNKNKQVGQKMWDICLGQIYTEGDPYSTWFYNDNNKNNCAEYGGIDNKGNKWNFWQALNQATGCQSGCPKWNGINTQFPCGCMEYRAVPMVCGSGNCQETVNFSGVSVKCLDERSTGQKISNLIKIPKPNPSFTNFAIWYGTGSQPFCKSPAPTCTF